MMSQLAMCKRSQRLGEDVDVEKSRRLERKKSTRRTERMNQSMMGMCLNVDVSRVPDALDVK